jgi:hypothetical protein
MSAIASLFSCSPAGIRLCSLSGNRSSSVSMMRRLLTQILKSQRSECLPFKVTVLSTLEN